MTTANRLNLLLSDILQKESSSSNGINYESNGQTLSSLQFAEHYYQPSSKLSSIQTTTQPVSSVVPLPPRRDPSSLRRRRQSHRVLQSDDQQQPLLNSSTLDDLFRALTLECEQYLAASSTSSYQNKTYGQLVISPSATALQTNVDSNDDDYENLHPKLVPFASGVSSLKTSIEVMSPVKRQVVSISVSSKISPSPIVSSSRTYPLLSNSPTTTIATSVPSQNCHSSEEDSIDVSSSSTNRKRRRRTRKQQIPSSSTRSSSSSEERTDAINGLNNEKKTVLSKRSCSTDHRQQRIKSIYDNHVVSSTQKYPTRRTRRRDVSLQQQQHSAIPPKYYEDSSPRFPTNLCSPLSVLLTSTRPTSDFVDRSQQQRQSRLPLVNQQPSTLLDRMHQQFYRPSPTRHTNNTNYSNIPTHRIPSYPVH